MKPLIVLFAGFVLSLVFIYFTTKEWNFLFSARIAMAIMLCFTAIGHFLFIDGMTAIIPDFIPFKKALVVSTGVLEIAFAIALLIPSFQPYVGLLLMLFFLAILPANIKGAIDGIDYQTGATDGPGLSYLWFRVPLQLLFILWVYFSAVWPFR